MSLTDCSTAQRILRSLILTAGLAGAVGTAFAQTPPAAVTLDGAPAASGSSKSQQVDGGASGAPTTPQLTPSENGSQSSGDERESPAPELSPAQGTTQMNMAMRSSRWHFMQDAVLFGMYNNQGGARGGHEFKAPNWWMGMASGKAGSSQLTLNLMFSLDPASTGKEGYGEIFQIGEALHGAPLIDRQHPHDLFMQIAGVWRIPVGSTTGLTFAGGPAGEPALGPVAFMHRASAAENPMAPLSHHTFDSTHIAFGVVTAAIDRGPLAVEASIFNGREPDENRWNFDVGRLDSVSGRVWFRPTQGWEFQVSSGRLTHPEELEEGNVIRTTASGSWLKRNGTDFTAVTAAYGMNAAEDESRHAVLVEGTLHRGLNSVYMRGENVDVETSLLLTGDTPSGFSHGRTDSVVAVTAGGIRDFLRWSGVEGGIGAGVTFYAVPPALKPSYGSRPVSFQVYFRLRPPAGSMGRMWNMRMSQPMPIQATSPKDPHAGHHR